MISVIVPVYNVETVLHYCLDSILAQSYRDFELILIDDGSTDSSGKICDEYAHKDNRILVRHIENQGVSHARNLGIEMASGEFILFIDSDDFVESIYLEELIHLHQNNPECDNIWCGFQTVDSYENPTATQSVVYSYEEPVTITSRKNIMTLHEKWLDAGPYCKLFKRSIIAENHLTFRQDLSLGEDLIFNFQYLDKTNGSIAILNKMLYSYMKMPEGTLSSKYYPDLEEIYRQIHSAMGDCVNRWGCDETQKAKLYNAMFYNFENIMRNTFHPQSKIDHKYHYNRQIMKSTEFQSILKKTDCFIHPLYRVGYRLSSYRLIGLLDYLHEKKDDINVICQKTVVQI